MTDPNSFSLADEFASFGDDLMGKAYEGSNVQMVVVKAETGTTGKGKVYIRPTLQFDGGPHSGKQIVDTLYWSPDKEVAVRIFVSSLNVLGAPADWVKTAKPSLQQICERIKGQKVEVNLKKDTFNGQPQTRVNYNKNLSGGPVASGGAATASATKAVSLDDDEPAAGAGTPAAAVVKENPAPAQATTVAETAPAATGSDPWGD